MAQPNCIDCNEHYIDCRCIKDADVSVSTEFTSYACTANGKGDYDSECCLDSNPEDCWIKNKPEKKEHCEYWKLVPIKEIKT